MSREVTSQQALAGIAKALADCESAIEHHPPRTVALYQQGKASFLEGQEGVEHTDWSRSTGLTLPQLALLHQYLFAASFMSAWFHMHWDKKRRDHAAHSACLLVSALGFDPPDVMRQFIMYEQIWRVSMRSAGMGLGRKLGWLLLLFLFLGLILWLAFR